MHLAASRWRIHFNADIVKLDGKVAGSRPDEVNDFYQFI
jgi:hypothetical protein